jgi:hypothetical protein
MGTETLTSDDTTGFTFNCPVSLNPTPTTSRGTIAFASGSLLTSQVVGAMEFANGVLSFTPLAGGRGVHPTEFFIISDGSTLSNTVNPQKLFDSVTNGTLSLEPGTYFFEALISASGMAAVSDNAAIHIRGSTGNATITECMFDITGRDELVNTAGAKSGSLLDTVSTGTLGAGTDALTPTTDTGMQFTLRGMFRVSVAGTIVPSIELNTAVGTVQIAAGSYFKCRLVGSATVISEGPWS